MGGHTGIAVKHVAVTKLRQQLRQQYEPKVQHHSAFRCRQHRARREGRPQLHPMDTLIKAMPTSPARRRSKRRRTRRSGGEKEKPPAATNMLPVPKILCSPRDGSPATALPRPRRQRSQPNRPHHRRKPSALRRFLSDSLTPSSTQNSAAFVGRGCPPATRSFSPRLTSAIEG